MGVVGPPNISINVGYPRVHLRAPKGPDVSCKRVHLAPQGLKKCHVILGTFKRFLYNVSSKGYIELGGEVV